MIDLSLYLAFCLATMALIILPGPVVSLIIANSLSQGTRSGLVTVAGANSGIAVQLVVVALGLTSVMAVMAELFEWLRWIGAAYLIWLGVQKWRSKPLLPDEVPVDRKNGKVVFVQGFLAAMTNPKLLLFFAAFFPQFMDPALPAGPQLAILCPSFLVIAAIFDGSYALAAGRARRWMRNRRRLMIGERVVGSFLIAAGAWLALARRN